MEVSVSLPIQSYKELVQSSFAKERVRQDSLEQP